MDGSKSKLLNERFTLTKKKHRDTRLCEIYTEGINNEIKFVPPKFRTHVSSTASESEKKHRRDETIYKVETQIKIMQDSIKEWTQRIEEIDTEMEVFIGANEHLREPIKQKVQTQEETAKINVEKESITKLLTTYEEEKKSGSTEFLLSFKSDDNSKNYQGRSRGRGRGNWRNHNAIT